MNGLNGDIGVIEANAWSTVLIVTPDVAFVVVTLFPYERGVELITDVVVFVAVNTAWVAEPRGVVGVDHRLVSNGVRAISWAEMTPLCLVTQFNKERIYNVLTLLYNICTEFTRAVWDTR